MDTFSKVWLAVTAPVLYHFFLRQHFNGGSLVLTMIGTIVVMGLVGWGLSEAYSAITKGKRDRSDLDA